MNALQCYDVLVRDEPGWCVVPECGCRSVGDWPMCAPHWGLVSTAARAAVLRQAEGRRQELPVALLRWTLAAGVALREARAALETFRARQEVARC